MSQEFTKDDQKFLDKLLERICQNPFELRTDQIAKLFYNLYGKNLAALEFEYKEILERAVYNRCNEFEFQEFIQVLATFKFLEKNVDEKLELALENYLEKLVPHEINFLLRYFYNHKVNIGLSDRIQIKLEDIIREDAPDMNSDELSITYSSLKLSQKGTPELLSYLEGNIKQSEKQFSVESIMYLMNLKTQGAADFFDVEKVGAPAILRLLKQKNFTPKQYTTVVVLFTAMKYYDVEFWKEVLSYMEHVQLPDAISYMQLHSSLSVLRKQIDIDDEMKLLESD
jgi:hypothetical protein